MPLTAHGETDQRNHRSQQYQNRPSRQSVRNLGVADHFKPPEDWPPRPYRQSQFTECKWLRLNEVQGFEERCSIAVTIDVRLVNGDGVAANLLGRPYLTVGPPYHRVPPDEQFDQQGERVRPMVTSHIMGQFVGDNATQLLPVQVANELARHHHHWPIPPPQHRSRSRIEDTASYDSTDSQARCELSAGFSQQ